MRTTSYRRLARLERLSGIVDTVGWLTPEPPALTELADLPELASLPELAGLVWPPPVLTIWRRAYDAIGREYGRSTSAGQPLRLTAHMHERFMYLLDTDISAIADAAFEGDDAG